MTPLSISPKIVSFTAGENQQRTGRDNVEDAAKATGVAGATTGGAMKFFKSANKASSTAVQTTRALQEPIKQTNSLFNTFRGTMTELFNQLSDWARGSNMPRFMKSIFTSKFGAFLGGVAAVFVFITGIGEVFNTASYNLYRLLATVPVGKNN